MKKEISEFSLNHYFLSNFFPAPITMEGETWPTVEHYYQAMKTTSKPERELIREAATPGRAKRLGRKVDLRSDWIQIRIAVMVQALRAKFSQNPHLEYMLLQTGDANLIEGNTWHDNFWGACSCPRCRGKKQKNHLGNLLMLVRKELKPNELIKYAA